ncbi:glycosyltransferase family 2 protein [Thioalkalivibrio paradoxus]|uniref:Glycosyl transferase n=1 Tax=Thioalkalivibrio paradoxus ARh 1 TaxID=713585 RepID=W0DHS1_9GAMM|nr:glycosyltransferase family 2 protein [Thioalkalivibrio paradoxus]AHE97966.1 glycosyl transferase [Thioalkalivibrio paradoxus ARh 1]
MTPLPITATVITLNEEAMIAGCIRSLRPVCDEIIVVDSLSADRTREIAAAEGARVIEQAYLGDGPQKAHGVPFARNDWILSLDADERLEDDAVALIRGLPLDDPRTAYALRRRNFVGNHWIRAAGFYPDSVVRLYHRGTSGYLPRKHHSRVEAPRVRRLKGHIRHFTYEDLSHWIRRIDELSALDAWAMKDRGVRPSGWRPAVHALVALLRKLVFKGGVFQGADGMTVAVTTAFNAYMKYAKLNELYEREQGGPRE